MSTVCNKTTAWQRQNGINWATHESTRHSDTTDKLRIRMLCEHTKNEVFFFVMLPSTPFRVYSAWVVQGNMLVTLKLKFTTVVGSLCDIGASLVDGRGCYIRWCYAYHVVHLSLMLLFPDQEKISQPQNLNQLVFPPYFLPITACTERGSTATMAPHPPAGVSVSPTPEQGEDLQSAKAVHRIGGHSPMFLAPRGRYVFVCNL